MSDKRNRDPQREPGWDRLTPAADTTTAQGQDTPRPDSGQTHTTYNTGGGLPDPDFGLQNTDGTPDVAYGNTDRGGQTNTAMTGHNRHGLEGMAAHGGSEDESTGGVLRGGDTTSGATVENNLPHGMGDEDPGGTMAQGTSQAPLGSGDVAPPDPDTATNQSTFTQGMRGTARDTSGSRQGTE